MTSTLALAEATLSKDGAEIMPQAVIADLSSLRDWADAQSCNVAGIRVLSLNSVAPLLETQGVIWRIATGYLGTKARAVRAVLFDKTVTANWTLGWHQDRTICVKRRVEVAGFGPWSMKRGALHVTPPFTLLERMVTLRVHLDDVPADNAPLRVARGSHRLGRIAANEAAQVAASLSILTCEAHAGDVWAYATPVLHASERAMVPSRRRVLQVDFAAQDLPGGLEWSGLS